jgi:hypothetical protein
MSFLEFTASLAAYSIDIGGISLEVTAGSAILFEDTCGGTSEVSAGSVTFPGDCGMNYLVVSACSGVIS